MNAGIPQVPLLLWRNILLDRETIRYTPENERMTIGKRNHLKMYLLLEMLIFPGSHVSVRGGKLLGEFAGFVSVSKQHKLLVRWQRLAGHMFDQPVENAENSNLGLGIQHFYHMGRLKSTFTNASMTFMFFEQKYIPKKKWKKNKFTKSWVKRNTLKNP